MFCEGPLCSTSMLAYCCSYMIYVCPFVFTAPKSTRGRCTWPSTRICSQITARRPLAPWSQTPHHSLCRPRSVSVLCFPHPFPSLLTPRRASHVPSSDRACWRSPHFSGPVFFSLANFAVSFVSSGLILPRLRLPGHVGGVSSPSKSD